MANILSARVGEMPPGGGTIRRALVAPCVDVDAVPTGRQSGNTGVDSYVAAPVLGRYAMELRRECHEPSHGAPACGP